MPNIAIKTEAVPSNSKLAADTNKTGSWSEQQLTEMTAEGSTFEGDKPLHKATAGFIYTGGSAGSSPVPPVISTVNLIPGKTLFLVGGQSVLLDGDKQQDIYGNKLKVCEFAAVANSC